MERKAQKGLGLGLCLLLGTVLGCRGCKGAKLAPEDAAVIEAGQVSKTSTTVGRPDLSPQKQVDVLSIEALKTMQEVPAGFFWLGCNRGPDNPHCDGLAPRKKAQLPTFYIDRTEVTVAEYRRCVEAGACSLPQERESSACNWSLPDREKHPINCVSWSQARNYCRILGKRLPTEQEWEKAARGEDGRIYPWGNQKPSCQRAIYAEGVLKEGEAKPSGCGRGGTWPSGSMSAGASPFGVLNMAGNLSEWTSSIWSKEEPSYRPTRGGNYRYFARALRVTNRAPNASGNWGDHIGFRCAASL